MTGMPIQSAPIHPQTALLSQKEYIIPVGDAEYMGLCGGRRIYQHSG